MFKKKLILLTIMFLLSIQKVSAQTVTVDGVGIDRDSAIRDATRAAVEQVVGTFIDSNTLAVNLVVELDEIYTKSQGYVKSIKVVSEESLADGGYRVKAIIDVDSNPNSELMNNLTMLYRLNDPRIGIIIVKDGGEDSDREDIAEEVLITKLLDLGFTHIVETSKEIQPGDIEYLVTGKSRVDTKKVTIPEYGGNGMVETGLSESQADIEVKVMKYDTGDIVGTFAVEGKGADSNDTRASNKAIKIASEKAAEELGKTFKKFGAKTTEGIKIIVSSGSYEKVEQLKKDLQGVSGVQNVYIREHNDGKATLEIESAQKPHIIIQLLRQRTKLGIFIDSVSNSVIKMNIT